MCCCDTQLHLCTKMSGPVYDCDESNLAATWMLICLKGLQQAVDVGLLGCVLAAYQHWPLLCKELLQQLHADTHVL